MKNTISCWSRWELKEVIPSTPTLLPSSHPPVHPTFRSIWRPITCMPLVHLCPPPRIELSNAQTCDCVCEHSHTHTQSLYSQTYSCIYILVSGDWFLEGQTRSCQLKHFVHLSRPPFISQLGSQKFADGKVSIKHPPGQTIWAQRHCQRPRSTCVITQHSPCLDLRMAQRPKGRRLQLCPLAMK